MAREGGGERRSSGSGQRRRSGSRRSNSSGSNSNSQSKSSQRRYFQRKRRSSKPRGPEGGPGRADEKKVAARARRRRRRRRDRVEPIVEEPTINVANDLEDYVEPTDVYVYTHVVRPYYQDSYEFRGDQFSKQGRQIEDYHIDISMLFKEGEENVLKDPFEMQPIDLSEPVSEREA